MKNNLLILMVVSLLFIGFLSTGVDYTGHSFRTTVSDRQAKNQDYRSVSGQNYQIYRGERFPMHTSPLGTGISFMHLPPKEDIDGDGDLDQRGDVDGDGDIDKEDFRRVMLMYSRTKDIPRYGGGERLNFRREYRGSTSSGYNDVNIGHYLPEGDLDKDGIITHKDVYWMYYLVNPFLGIQTPTMGRFVRQYECAEIGRKVCANYPGSKAGFEKFDRVSRSYIGTCIELLPGSGTNLYGWDYDQCPVGTECGSTYNVITDDRGYRQERLGAECKPSVYRQDASMRASS